jgi:hypothetical protein
MPFFFFFLFFNRLTHIRSIRRKHNTMRGRSDEDVEDSSTESVDSFLLKERQRTDSLTRRNSLPKTLPTHNVVTRPLLTTGSGGTNNSPRQRTQSDCSGRRLVKTKSTQTLVSEEERASAASKLAQEEAGSDYDEEYAILQLKKEFISRSLREKTYAPKKMVSGDVTFFEEVVNGSDFCVTAKSSPYSTPPPERVMSPGVYNREMANLKIELKKVKDQMAYMSQQQQNMNNYYIEMKREREEEKRGSSTCCLCWPSSSNF